MNYKKLFRELIATYLEGSLTRADVSRRMTEEVPLDDICGDHRDLLPNCEHALRHMDDPDYYTVESELKYYLACLEGRREFSEVERDKAIRQQG